VTRVGIPLAITLQVISSFLFASGATLQHLGVKSTFDPNATASSNRLTLMGMLKLLLIPKWLLGLLCVFSGAGLHLWQRSIGLSLIGGTGVYVTLSLLLG